MIPDLASITGIQITAWYRIFIPVTGEVFSLWTHGFCAGLHIRERRSWHCTGCGRGRYLSRVLDQKKDNRLESIVKSQDGVTITYEGKSYRFFSFWIMDNYIDWSTLSCDTTHLPRYFSLWERSYPPQMRNPGSQTEQAFCSFISLIRHPFQFCFVYGKYRNLCTSKNCI